MTERKLTQHQMRLVRRAEVIQFWGTICPICGRGGATDVHEVIVTRGMLPGREGDLTDPRNCVVVHNGACHTRAATREGKEQLIKLILSRFTCEQVREFINSLNMTNPPRICDEP